MIESGAVHVATFTSPSTVDNTVAALGTGGVELLQRLTLASIGPITTEAAARHGLRVAVTAARYTGDGLVDALEQHFKETR
jgi:uroporphyrinogen III methyltransferase/synthase